MSILIYSKLDPASGNATSAERLAGFLAADEPIVLRHIGESLPDDPAALADEIAALRRLADEAQLTLAIGIHCSRAGLALHAAFGGRIPYLLIASGTDLNAVAAMPPASDEEKRHAADGDLRRLQKISPNATFSATLRAVMAGAAAIVTLSPDLQRKADAVLATLPPNERPPAQLIPQAPGLATSSTFSLRAALGLSAEQKLIVLPAGVRPVKGVAFAIEAMSQALLDHPTHVFAILGPALDADYHAHCASLIGEWRLRQRSLKGRLHLLDGLPRADYLAALREADLLLNTSESEGLSNAILEALGCGVPVLARDIPGNRAVIAEGVTGLCFDRLTAFLRQYARLFADAALRAELITNGRAHYRTYCDVAAEKAAYRALIDTARPYRPQQISLPSGAEATLLLAAGTHAPAPDNRRLFARLGDDPVLRYQRPERLLDIGCGSGVFGWTAADLLATGGHRFSAVDFIDNDTASVAALRLALHRHRDWWSIRTDRIGAFAGDLFAALPDDAPGYDLILANLPQTPAPTAIANDRYGGSGEAGGASLLLRFIAELPLRLAPGGVACGLHIGLAHPARVAAAIREAGLQAEVIAEETRCVDAADYDALQPGLADFLIGQGQHGNCELSVEDHATGRKICFPVRLIRLRRIADC